MDRKRNAFQGVRGSGHSGFQSTLSQIREMNNYLSVSGEDTPVSFPAYTKWERRWRPTAVGETLGLKSLSKQLTPLMCLVGSLWGFDEAIS